MAWVFASVWEKCSPDLPKARGIDRFQLGYANRTLGYSLPIKAVKAGGGSRARLAKRGLNRESGHEHFTGSLVIPVLDEAGTGPEVNGRKILDNLRKGTPYHLYLPAMVSRVIPLVQLTSRHRWRRCQSLHRPSG